MNLKTRNKVSVNFSMASMTDVVFLLLIFFMLTSTLISPNALKVLLPESSSKTLTKQTISVTITKNIEYYIGKDKVEEEFLETMLKKRLSGQEEPSIVLHVEKSVPVEYAVKVMDIAYRNKYKLVLATRNSSK